MPDKAIDLIDEAASRVRMYRSASPPSLKEAMRGLEALQQASSTPRSRRKISSWRAELRDRERKLRERISQLEKDWKEEQQQRRAGRHRRGHRPGRLDVDRHPADAHRRRGVASGCCRWRRRCTSGSSARTRRSRRWPRPSAAPARG